MNTEIEDYDFSSDDEWILQDCQVHSYFAIFLISWDCRRDESRNIKNNILFFKDRTQEYHLTFRECLIKVLISMNHMELY